MKKIFAILFISSFAFANSWNGVGSDSPTAYNKEIISSTDSETIVRFTLEGYSLTPLQTPNGDAYKVGTMLGASLLETGAPDVQKLSASLKVPNDKHMTSHVVSSEFIEVENIVIAPSKGNLSRLINPDDIEYSWGDTYNENAFYPGKLTDLNTPYILRDFRGQAANVYPFQYNPITETLRIYTEIVISVEAGGPGEINVISNDDTNTIDHDFMKVYNNHFDNFNTTETRFDFVAEQGNMLIVSYGDFMDEMEPFVEWKNRKGIPTEMVNVADIGGNSSSIESFVDTYYHDNGLTFLLLVGDINQVPTPSVGGSGSDPSYGFVDGNDAYAELFVGRFSANSPTELITQIERTLDYEQNAQAGADWYHTALSVGSNQGPGWGGLTDDVFLDTIIDPMLLDYTYTSSTGIYDPNQSIQGGIDAINNGVSIINYTGHGWQQGWGNGAPLEVSHVNNLDNAGKLPFVITVGCNVGEFNTVTNSFGEAWLRATNNGEAVGGIGHYGSTISQSWEPPMHGQYGMNLILTENFEDGISHTVGGITTNGCMYMNDMQGASGINETNYWTLFGDPSVHLRTDEPASLNASYSSSIVLGASSLDISYTGSEVIAALSQNGELLAYGYGNNGMASIDFSNIDLQPGEYDLVLTGYNAFTEEAIVNVIAPEGAFIIHDGYSIQNDWDDSENLVYGQSSNISLLIQNVGVDNASQVTASVSTDDLYASISNGQVSFGDISANSSAQSNNSFEVDLLNATPDGHLVEFSVEYSDGDSSWEGGFSIAVNAPVFVASNPQIIDTDGNGVWDAGESATIIVNCANEGSADFNNYPGATISTNSEYISLNTGMDSNTWYAIFSGSSYDAEFEVTADADTPDGAIASFTVIWGNSSTTGCENDCVANHEFTFSTTIGVPLSDDAAIPENLTVTETNNGIMVEWDQPNVYDCVAEAPYSDDCYGYVISIDPYCCTTAWDTLCEMEYDECDWNGNDTGGNEACGDGYCDEYSGENTDNCPEDCEDTGTGGGGECGDGMVEDCSGDGDCCSEYWIGDGVGDCEDQLYGCDLTCYDNDGGDCGDLTSWNNGELTYEQRSRRAENPPILVSYQNQQSREEILGYNVFEDGSHIAYAENTFHLDEDYLEGTTYCYTVSALYEEYQSYQTAEVCVTTEGTPFTDGDVNTDEQINVLDIVMLVNMILGSETPNYELGDLNDDGNLNVLDIILIINIILDSRSADATEVQLIKSDRELSLNSDGFIAGIELKISHNSGAKLSLTNDALISQSSTKDGISHIVIVAPESDALFEIDSHYDILDVIIANSSGQMDVQYANEFKLSQAYPNPFNPSTTFSLSLPNHDFVNVSIYNMLGQTVATLHNSQLNAGQHDFVWNADELSTGLYVISVNSNNFTTSQKVMLLK
ncbi:MAG: T9SS type A sorting domain-containing protein [Candidatus Marinimicrobia bacterium]|nr:T9SS type A sorting domain-containing protein [Candidatus Neomarinimicrobiota bacterium]